MPRPVSRALDMAEHDRRRRTQADLVRRLVNMQPLLGVHLVRADDGPDLVVEDLGGRTRKRREAGVAQALEVVAQGYAEGSRALPDLEGGERVQVELGQSLLDRTADVDVEVTGEGGVDPALEANLGRAALPGLPAPPDDLVERHQVRRPAEVRRQLAFREG